MALSPLIVQEAMIRQWQGEQAVSDQLVIDDAQAGCSIYRAEQDDVHSAGGNTRRARTKQ